MRTINNSLLLYPFNSCLTLYDYTSCPSSFHPLLLLRQHRSAVLLSPLCCSYGIQARCLISLVSCYLLNFYVYTKSVYIYTYIETDVCCFFLFSLGYTLESSSIQREKKDIATEITLRDLREHHACCLPVVLFYFSATRQEREMVKRCV